MLGKLREKNVTHVYVVGLALDVCVAFTALHAAEEGFVTHVVTDACAGVTIEGINAKKDAFEKAGISVCESSELDSFFKQSSLDECVKAAVRVRGAKEICSGCKDEAGHRLPTS